jgi:hypothetical protein
MHNFTQIPALLIGVGILLLGYGILSAIVMTILAYAILTTVVLVIKPPDELYEAFAKYEVDKQERKRIRAEVKQRIKEKQDADRRIHNT